jgi:hypothetical protein
MLLPWTIWQVAAQANHDMTHDGFAAADGRRRRGGLPDRDYHRNNRLLSHIAPTAYL